MRAVAPAGGWTVPVCGVIGQSFRLRCFSEERTYQAHGGRGHGTGKRGAQPADRLEVRAQLEELAGGHAHKRRDELAEDGIAGLGEGRLDGVKVEDGSSALVSGQSAESGSG